MLNRTPKHASDRLAQYLLQRLVELQQQPRTGFSLPEVLIALVITGLFFIVVMQGSLVGARTQVSAQDAAQAVAWVQEDLAQVQYQASILETGILTSNAAIGTSSITLDSAANFKVNDLIMFTNAVDTVTSPNRNERPYRVTSINSNTLSISPAVLAVGHTVNDKLFKAADNVGTLTSNTTQGTASINITYASSSAPRLQASDKIRLDSDLNVYTINSVSGNTLSISPSLIKTYNSGTPIGLTKCSPSAYDRGYGDALRDLLSPSGSTPIANTGTGGGDITTVSISKTNLNGKQFTLERKMTLLNNADAFPYGLLRLDYVVSSTNPSQAIIAPYTTQVMPNAALYCQ